MAKDTGRRWRNRLIVVCAKNRLADANIAVAAWGWGAEFFSIPLHNKVDGAVKEYAADVVLSDVMLAQLQTLVPSTLELSDFEKPVTKDKGSARLREVAIKRDVDLKKKV